MSVFNTTTYHINPSIRLHWATWDDEYVVFDECSGQTHQMDATRAFVLNNLCSGAQSFEALFAELANIPSLASTKDLSESLTIILKELGTHGLVEVTDP